MAKNKNTKTAKKEEKDFELSMTLSRSYQRILKEFIE